MRLTKKVFLDLAIYMSSFGLLIGIVFPFFMLVMGIPSAYVMTVPFFLSCIVAGVIVGTINILLAKTVVGKRIGLLSKKMQFIVGKLNDAKSLSDLEDCDSQECLLPVDSADELGESAQAYNTLLQALSNSIASESAVRSFNNLLSSQLELEILAKNAVDRILRYLDADAGAVIIERGGEFEVIYSFGIKDPSGIVANENLWKLFESSTMQRNVFDGKLTIDCTLLSFQPDEVLTLPIVYKDVPLGLLVIATRKILSSRSLQTLEMFNQCFSLALNNAITYDQLQKLAANDPLTGLYNRRFGMTRLTEEFSRSVRTHLPLGLLIFDIDHFKRVNDTYGHTVGDKVLLNLAKITAMAARKGDLTIRYGGEEFIVILPGADKKDCAYIAERLRHMVEESIIQMGDIQIRVTISIGVASYPEYNVENEHALIKSADKALYMAKDQGRNMVVFA